MPGPSWSDGRRGGELGGARQFLLDLAAVAAYLGLGWLSARFAVLDNLTAWYAPAGLTLGFGVVRGWRALPAMVVGEVLVGLLLFGVADDLGWLVVPNGVLYAAVDVGSGRLTPIRVTGGVTADTVRLQVDDEGPGIDAAGRRSGSSSH